MPSRILSEAEFSAIRDQVLRALPDGLTEAEYPRVVGPLLAAAIGKAEQTPAAPEGSALERFTTNAAGMLNPIAAVTGIYGAVRHPIDTASAIGSGMASQAQEARAAAAQGRYVEAAGHGLAAVLPVVGPAAASAGEQIGAGDIAGGFGTAAGLLAPAAVPSVMRGARAAVPAGLRATLAEHLETGAARRVADVMAPKVGANKTRFGTMAADVAPTLAKMDEGAAWSREGLHAQIASRLEQAQGALDDVANTRLNGKAFPTEPIIQDLLAKRRRLTAEPIEGSHVSPARSNLTAAGEDTVLTEKTGVPLGKDVIPGHQTARVAQIDQAIAEIRDLGPLARYEALRRIREAFDQPARIKYHPSMTADFLKRQGEASGAADVTGVLRESLARFDPATAAANADYTVFRAANDVLDATAEVQRTRPTVGRQIMARLTGSMVGQQAAGVPGAVTGFVFGPALDAAVSSGVTTKLQTARLMTQLADAVRGGHVGSVASLTSQLQKLASQAAVVQGATSPSVSPAQPARAIP